MIAKFIKKSEENNNIVAYIPVLQWKEYEDYTIGMVPGMKGTVEAGYLYPVISETIVDFYGNIQYYLDEDALNDDMLDEFETDELEAFEVYNDKYLEAIASLFK